MGKFVKGDVVVIPFPFSDLSGSKRRPALVVANLDGDDMILCQITSIARGDSHAISLGTGDFESGTLPAQSFVRPSKIFTADQRLVLYLACRLKSKKMQDITAAIVEILEK